MRLLIAPDKFKGTLSATEAADAIARGWRRERPDDAIACFPISDGGDGFGELLARHLGAEERSVATVNAAHEPIVAPWWWVPGPRLALIESARIIGLAMLPRGRHHPFDLDTFGLGAALRAAAALRPRTCLVGIGGSATNDGGTGLARALGWQFRDRRQQPLERWPVFTTLDRIEPPRRPVRFRELKVAVDVRNPFLGLHGATRVYGPQKGIRPADVAPAERALSRLARLVHRGRHESKPLARTPGTGAAGGLGFGLAAFAGGQLAPGFELFAQLSGLEARVREADLVVTGEGAIDRTTLTMGKGVGQLMQLCDRLQRPWLGLAGRVDLTGATSARRSQLHAMAPDLAPPEEAMRRPALWLARLGQQAARDWSARARG